MWWPSQNSVVVLDAGLVAMSSPRHEVRECLVGEEVQTLRELLGSRSGRVDVLLGPTFVRLAAIDRIDGVWRSHERAVAAGAVLGLSPDEMQTIVLDPAPGSRWLTVSMQRSVKVAIKEAAVAGGARLGRVEPLMLALPRSFAAGAPAWLSLLGRQHASWLVMDGARVLGAGRTERTEATVMNQHFAREALRLGLSAPIVQSFEIGDNDGDALLSPLIRRIVRHVDADET